MRSKKRTKWNEKRRLCSDFSQDLGSDWTKTTSRGVKKEERLGKVRCKCSIHSKVDFVKDNV